MKRMTLIGFFVLAGVVVVGVATALKTGEKSPVFVAGQIEIPQEFRPDAVGIATMFVIIFDEDSPMPMPYGAMKEHLSTDLPFDRAIAFALTKEKLQIMRPDAPLPKYLKIKVRFDKDGIAGPDQPGDLVGMIEHVAFGSRDIQLKIQSKI